MFVATSGVVRANIFAQLAVEYILLLDLKRRRFWWLFLKSLM